MSAAVQTADILAANLAQLRRTEPELVHRLEFTAPASLTWEESRAGPPIASIERDGRVLALASRYDPLHEAEKLVEKIDYSRHACIVALGCGLGYHIAEVCRKLDDAALLIVFEPGVDVLRAVLARVDHTSWLGRHNVIVADDRVDRSALMARIERFAGTLAQGTLLLTHPPSRQIYGQALNDFGRIVTEVLTFCRTNVATHLVNASRTIYNLAMNLPYYAAGSTTDGLFNAARGYPAVCVGAGPSLARNVHLLADPQVRRQVVLISAQTTLRPLLDRGIRPDFVTALDYSEISSRFYENLPALPDVTLVAEPLAHPSILDSYPGPIRTTSSGLLDRFLGQQARPIIPIQQGATVAHLSVYLAQHLGCDPIILIGQDLAFSDGLYYCPGTAIHEVWRPELGQFNTVEMMEWQRIVRHRGQLQRCQDVHGHDVYSDEQMLTYQKQFERDFAQAPQRIVDATEGGLPKAHTVAMTLQEALVEYAEQPVPNLPLPPIGFDAQELARVVDTFRRRLEEAAELRRVSRKTVPLLRQMHACQSDQKQLHRLFDRMTPMRKRVRELHEIFTVIDTLNSVGMFKRVRADRAIEHANTDDYGQQRMRLERDIENVDWLIQACDEATKIFREAMAHAQAKHKGSAATNTPSSGRVVEVVPTEAARLSRTAH